MAIPPFLKSSHFLLGAHTINSSWMGARYVFFFPNTALSNVSYNRGYWHEGKDVMLQLRAAGAGREAPAVTRAPSFTPVNNLCFQLFTKCNFSKATPDTARAQSPAEAVHIDFVPLGSEEPIHHPQTPWCASQPDPPAPLQPLPLAQCSSPRIHLHCCADPPRPAAAAVVSISHH